MSSRKYIFVSQEDKNGMEGPIERPLKYYQVCGFANPKTNKFEIRVVNIDEYDRIASFDTYAVTEETKKKLIKSLRDNEYRVYAVYSVQQVKLPEMNDIRVARSSMICENNNYSGFAPF